MLAVLAALGAAGTAVGVSPSSAHAAVTPAGRGWRRDAASAPRLPRDTTALRAVPDTTAIRADVVLKPRDPGALEAFDHAVSTPGNPNFRHYLAPGDFDAAFGPAPSVTASVRGWLAGQGLTVGATSPDGLLVPVRGTAAQMGQAFDVGLEEYRLPTGRVARAPTEAPLVPSALADDLYGVVGLDDVNLQVPQLAHPADGPAGPGAAPAQSDPAPSSAPRPRRHRTCRARWPRRDATPRSTAAPVARGPSPPISSPRRTRSRACTRARKARA